MPCLMHWNDLEQCGTHRPTYFETFEDVVVAVRKDYPKAFRSTSVGHTHFCVEEEDGKYRIVAEGWIHPRRAKKGWLVRIKKKSEVGICRS